MKTSAINKLPNGMNTQRAAQRLTCGLVATAFVAVILFGCGGDENSKDPEPQSLRDSRYCEVIPIYLEGGGVRADVYNTIGFNNCPQADWDALDTAEIAAEMGAVMTVMNGPRSFIMDGISSTAPPGEVRCFGALDTHQVASIIMPLPEALNQKPYILHEVERTNDWEYWTGSEVYELIDPAGVSYVMQSYAMIVDPELTAADLATLGERIQPPTGWIFRARTLESELLVRAAGRAYVLQDELRNTYQRIP